MLISSSIKNILFDLGGVILNIDFSLTKVAFQELGMINFNEICLQMTLQELFNDFETGKITAAFFRNRIRKFIPKKISDNEFDRAWNSMLLDIPAERLKLLSSLKSRYQLFLLSNTNEIHIKAFSDYLLKTYGFPDLTHIFIKEYFSYKVGMQKPEPGIFEQIINENHLQKAEILFIDDTAKHIEAAKEIGFETLLLKKGVDICSLGF